MMRKRIYRPVCLGLAGLMASLTSVSWPPGHAEVPRIPAEPAALTAPMQTVESQERSVIDVTMPEATYIMGSGDEILVEDATMGKLSTGNTKILTDGTVDLPLVGEIRLAGLTLEQAQDLLNEKYKTYYVNPAINIQVLYAHPIRVYVRGAINNPGVYVSGTTTKPSAVEKYELGTARASLVFHQFYLVDLLLQAGGLKQNANIKDIVIHRTFPQTQTIHVNLWELVKSGQTLQDLPLREQDVVEISSLPQDALVSSDEWKVLARTNFSQNHFNVNVIGAVAKPGTYKMSNTDGVLNALAMAGGFTQQADKDGVFVLRTNAAGQVFKKRINARDGRLMSKGKPEWGELLPEDVIFVDESAAGRLTKFGSRMTDRAVGAAMLPYFNQLLRDDE